MSAGRFIDLLLVLVGLVAIMVVQTSTAPVMDEFREFAIEEDDPGDDIEATSYANEMHTAVTKWVPTIGAIGLWVIAGFREFRRQRITAERRRRV